MQRRRGSIVAAAVVLVGLASTGCWSKTETISAAVAEPGSTGFGAARHTHTFYAVLAASTAQYTGAGQVAMVQGDVPGVTDSVWRAYDGGRRVQHCFIVQDGRHFCVDAQDEELPWGQSFVFIDPVNLGNFLVETTTTAYDGRFYYNQYVASGGYVDTDQLLPAGPGHGVWAAIAGGPTLFHCQLEGNLPRCRPLPFEGEGPSLFAGGTKNVILGVFANLREDTLWVGRPEGVYRCTASPGQPKPRCVPARM